MPTVTERRETLQTAINNAVIELTTIKEQLDAIVLNDAFDDDTTEGETLRAQASDLNMRLLRKTYVKENAEAVLAAFNLSVANVTAVDRKADYDTLDAEYTANRNILGIEWDDRVQFVEATCFVNKSQYRADWKEFIAAVGQIDDDDDVTNRMRRYKRDWSDYLAATTDTTMSNYQIDWEEYLVANPEDTDLSEYTEDWNA